MHSLTALTTIRFAKHVVAADEFQSALSRIKSTASSIPKARASVEVNDIADWIDTYRRQIIWNETVMEAAIKGFLDKKRVSRPSKAEIVKFAVSAIVNVEVEPGLVRINLSDDAKTRVNRSRPLSSTRHQIASLKYKLIVTARAILAEALDENYERLIANGVVEAERDLNDDTGSIIYQEENSRIEIAPAAPSNRLDLRALVLDALADLVEPETLRRAHNVNPRIVSLVSVYENRFALDTPDDDILLYSSGVKLVNALATAERPTYEDETLPGEFIEALKTLLVHHEAYIWSVPRIREVIEHRRRTLESYGTQVIDRAQIQHDILQNFVERDDLFGRRTRQTIKEYSEVDNEALPSAIGPEALRYGMLRGALQFMGRIVVQARKTGSKAIGVATASVIGAAASLAVKHSSIYPPIVSFFEHNLDRLTHLASTAQDWHWLQYVISFLRMRG